MDALAGGGDADAPLRADSVAVLLGQALQAQDRALLEKCAATPAPLHGFTSPTARILYITESTSGMSVPDTEERP